MSTAKHTMLYHQLLTKQSQITHKTEIIIEEVTTKSEDI